MAATPPRRTRARETASVDTEARKRSTDDIVDMSLQTEFRPYDAPKRSTLGNIGVIAGGIVTFIGSVLAAYAPCRKRASCEIR